MEISKDTLYVNIGAYPNSPNKNVVKCMETYKNNLYVDISNSPYYSQIAPLSGQLSKPVPKLLSVNTVKLISPYKAATSI